MDSISKSLASYSSTVNQYADKINNALLPIATIMLLTFFILDILSWNKRLGQEGGNLTVQLWFETALGYIFALLLVFYSSEIFDVIVFAFNKGITLVNSVLPKTGFKSDVDNSGVSVAPVIMAFFMSEKTRNITIGFLKIFAAYAFQGLLLVIIIKLYPALVSDDMFKAGKGDLVTAFASIGKSVVYIMCLFGSQKQAKTLLNAM